MISFVSLQDSPKLGVVKGGVLRSVQAHLWPWCSQRHAGSYPAASSSAQTGWAGLRWTPWNLNPRFLGLSSAAQLPGKGNQLGIRTSPFYEQLVRREGKPGLSLPFPSIVLFHYLSSRKAKFSLAGAAAPRSVLATEGLAVPRSQSYWGAPRAAGLGVRCPSLQRKAQCSWFLAVA